MKRPAVFLDRDNTIIHNDGDLGDPDQVRLVQSAASAIASLCGLGFRIVVVTNQGGVARGKYGEEDVEKVHERIRELVTQKTTGAHIDAFYYCPFHPKGTVEAYTREHEDRKPQPGMLLRAAEDFSIDLSRSWMVGDALRDCEAGRAAGTRTIHLIPDSGSPHGGEGPVDYVVSSLVEAVRLIAQARYPDSGDDLARTGSPRIDKSFIADLQQSDAAAKASSGQTYKPQKPASFKPVGAPTDDFNDDEPIAKQIRRRQLQERRAAAEARAAEAKATESKREGDESDEADNPMRKIVRVVRRRQAPNETFALDDTSDEAALESEIIHDDHEPPAPTTREPEPLPVEPVPAALRVAPVPDAETIAPSQDETDHGVASEENADAFVPTSRRVPSEDQSTDDLLRQLIQDIRRGRLGNDSRHEPSEMGSLELFAIGLQAVTLVCLMGGYFMDGEAIIRWMGTAIVAQLAVIAVLLAAKRR